jgi:hypothetical protein
VTNWTVGTWVGDWKWGLLLIVVTVTLHTTGLVVVAVSLHRFRPHLHRLGIPGMIVVTASLSLAVSVLIAAEVLIWAVAYRVLEAVPTFHHAVYYSLTMITTTGVDVVDLEPHWRLMGSLEALAGVLVAGLSTAFIFACLQRMWPANNT